MDYDSQKAHQRSKAEKYLSKSGYADGGSVSSGAYSDDGQFRGVPLARTGESVNDLGVGRMSLPEAAEIAPLAKSMRQNQRAAEIIGAAQAQAENDRKNKGGK